MKQMKLEVKSRTKEPDFDAGIFNAEKVIYRCLCKRARVRVLFDKRMNAPTEQCTSCKYCGRKYNITLSGIVTLL